MKVALAIKEHIADYIQDGITDADEILTNLVDFGIVDDEYEVTDENGVYDESYDRLVQAHILLEIKKQLKK